MPDVVPKRRTQLQVMGVYSKMNVIYCMIVNEGQGPEFAIIR